MPGPTRDPSELIPQSELRLEEPVLSPQELGRLMRTRLVWDLVPDDMVQEWAEDMDINHVSDEVAKTEMAAAEIRRNRLNMLQPALSEMSVTAADIISRARLLTIGSEPVPESEGTLLVEDDGITAAVVAGTFAVIAELMDMGVLGVIVRRQEK